MAAGFAAGLWKSFEELKQINRANRTIFKPEISANDSAKMYRAWERAVNMCRGWLEEEEETIKDA